MTRIGMQFCPSCGRYWVPAGPEEASRKVVQRCRVCHARVELSWLGFSILGTLLSVLMATSLLEAANNIALGTLVLLLGIAAFKAVKQYQATKRRAFLEGKGPGVQE